MACRDGGGAGGVGVLALHEAHQFQPFRSQRAHGSTKTVHIMAGEANLALDGSCAGRKDLPSPTPAGRDILGIGERANVIDDHYFWL